MWKQKCVKHVDVWQEMYYTGITVSFMFIFQ